MFGKLKRTGILLLLLLANACSPFQSQPVQPPVPNTGPVVPTTTPEPTTTPTPVSPPPVSPTPTPVSPTPVPPTGTVAITIQPPNVPTSIVRPRTGASAMVDFLIQDVCVDASDQPISGDPSVCSRHRDLKFGEFVPYMRTTRYLSAGNDWMSSISFPTQAPDGSLLIMKTYDYGNRNLVNGRPTAFRDEDASYPGFFGGFDLQEINGEYASVLATQADKYYEFWGTGCRNDDAWQLFPANAFGTIGVTTSSIGVSVGSTCSTSLSLSRNQWDLVPKPMVYSSGRSLATVSNIHFDVDSSGNLAGDHTENFYWTREFGGTRWEAWYFENDPQIPESQVQDALAKCGGPRTRVFLGRTLKLAACEDWSFVKALDVPFNPLTSTNGRHHVLSRNRLVAGDFAGATLLPWTIWDPIATQTTADFVQQLDAGNSSLRIQCQGLCAGGGIYQDLDSRDLAGPITLRLGGLFKADRAAQIIVALFFYDGTGRVVDQTVKTFNLAGQKWQNHGTTISRDFTARPAAQIRFQVYLESGVQYLLDEVYLTPAK